MSAPMTLSRRPSPLPVELTPLLGRTGESDQLLALLADPALPLITLTGPGGVGKTRLALHVATTLRDRFDDDVAFVPLASIQDPALVLPAIVQTFGEFSDAQDAPEDQLVDILQDRALFLVLDNLEQVLGAAPALANVLMRCPRVTVLATSRAPLGIAGEQLYPLPPLLTPSPALTTVEELLHVDAVTLFVQRARAVNPHLAIDDQTAPTLAEITRRLDGLPLAIELAAARSNILSPAALLSRLGAPFKVLGGERRDVPDRLRTMHNAIAWSHDLLRPEEQLLFRRMAVFVGGISLEAVEAITPSTGSRDPFDMLSALVDHSLVRAVTHPSGDTRFLMLETIRDYGLEQLALHGEEQENRLAHANYVVALAELNNTVPIAQRIDLWNNRLDPDLPNIRAAAEWARTHDHPTLTLRIGAAIWNYWANRGQISECLAWLHHALAACDDDHIQAYDEALYGAGCLANFQGDMSTAKSHFEAALAHAASTGRFTNEFRALTGLGAVAQDTGDFATAIKLHSRAAELAQRAGEERSVAISFGNMGNIAYFQGKLDDARNYYQQSQSRFAAAGDTKMEAVASSNLGAVTLDQGDFTTAASVLDHALELKRQIQAKQDIPDTLINIGRLSRARGDYRHAEVALTEAITLARENGQRPVEALAMIILATVKMDAGNLSEAASLTVESTQLGVEIDERLGLMENAECAAALCAKTNNYTGAVEMLAAAAHHRAALDATPTPLKMAELAGIEVAAREHLSVEDYRAGWEAGNELDVPTMCRRISILVREIVSPRQPFTVPDHTAEPLSSYNLTAREMDVLRLLAEGNSTAGISEALFISPRTAATHISNLFGKLEVSNRTAAVAVARRANLI